MGPLSKFDDEYAPFTYETGPIVPAAARPVGACQHSFGAAYSSEWLGSLVWKRACVCCPYNEITEKVKV